MTTFVFEAWMGFQTSRLLNAFDLSYCTCLLNRQTHFNPVFEQQTLFIANLQLFTLLLSHFLRTSSNKMVTENKINNKFFIVPRTYTGQKRDNKMNLLTFYIRNGLALLH